MRNGKTLASVSIQADHKLVAGASGAWKLKVILDHFRISPGGTIKIGYDGNCGIALGAHCQGDRPDKPNYVSCGVPDGVKVRIAGYDLRHYEHRRDGTHTGVADLVPESYQWRDIIGFDVNLNMQVCEITVEEGKLGKGDALEVLFGDASGGFPGMQLPFHSREEWKHFVVAQGKAGGPMKFLGKGSLTVLPGRAEKLLVTVPSLIKEGELFTVHTVAFDRGHNPVKDIDTFAYSGPEPMKNAGKEGFSASKPGTYRVKAKAKGASLAARSNPIWCTGAEPEHRLYWGEIHGHSNYSDGGALGADDYYRWARDIEHLDFSALTDHDFGIALEPREKKWLEIVQAGNKFNQAGEFVTFIGWELSCIDSNNSLWAYKNIYFIEDNPPFFNRGTYGGKRVKIDYRETEELWDLLAGRRFIVIPHHPLLLRTMTTNCWDNLNDHCERLAEIYSCWGSSEEGDSPIAVRNPRKDFSVQKALARGHRLGFTGGTDNHNARPGSFDNFMFPQKLPGLTAVWAEELSRKAIFEALWQRRCYATRGARIILDVRLNRNPMGSELSLRDINKTAQIEIRASGTESLSVEILRNNCVISAWKDVGEEVALQYEDDSFLLAYEKDKLLWYYVRLTQPDGGMAWSSPIWIASSGEA